MINVIVGPWIHGCRWIYENNQWSSNKGDINHIYYSLLMNTNQDSNQNTTNTQPSLEFKLFIEKVSTIPTTMTPTKTQQMNQSETKIPPRVSD